MYASTQGTVAFYKSRPFMQERNFAESPSAHLLLQLLMELKQTNKECIGSSAFDFYLMNHGFSLIVAANAPHAQLPHEQQEFAELYLKRGGHIGRRMFLDLVGLLCTLASSATPDPFHIESVEDTYGPAAGAIIRAAVDQPSGLNSWMPGNQSAVIKTVTGIYEAAVETGATIDQTIAALTDILDWNKRKLAYGPMWRDVGNASLAFCRGKKSLEVITDSLFSYCHCSGSFFEKGALFAPVGQILFGLLDVQRSGQVPQLAHKGHALLKSADGQQALALGRKLFPHVFRAKLDPSKVPHVTQNELTFHNKYKQAWNAAVGGGAGWAQNPPPPKPLPKIFMPLDEDSYADIRSAKF